MEMEEDSKGYTIFSVGNIYFYEWNRMCFVLTKACAPFQHLTKRTMGDLHLKECFVFLDDILIFSIHSEEHIQRLEAVFHG